MTLSDDDTYTLENWFCELRTYANDSEQYLALRDKIYTFIYHRLNDLLLTKTGEWQRRYALTDEDANSIFNDVLLACVDKYQPKRVKFISYFWTACENQAKNYYKRHHRQKRIPKDHLVNVDFSALNSPSDISFEENAQSKRMMEVMHELKLLCKRDADVLEFNISLYECLDALLLQLNPEEALVLKGLTEHGSIRSLGRALQFDDKYMSLLLRGIRKKAKKLWKKYA